MPATRWPLPIFVALRDVPVTVVGAGTVAERRIAALLDAGARVTVVAPRATPVIDAWAADGLLELRRRPFQAGDLRGARLAYAATSIPEVNRAVQGEARVEGVWLNAVDEPALCDFITPALVRRGDLTIAISTDGRAPGFAKGVRQELERFIGPEYEERLDEAAHARKREAGASRHTSREEERRTAQEVAAGEDALHQPSGGSVALVGAGPGDPELLTLKGRRLLERADTVVYDALVNSRLLEFCEPAAERIYVGKRDSRHTLPQAEINELLVARARAGRRVVRLKGGDPFIFGRGGEEAEALALAGIAFEVVPGVSAGVAVPASAGIPLTHRDYTSELVFLTGHECVSNRCPIDWSRYGKTTASLVIFMGVHNLGNIAGLLLEHGRDPDCPVAVIENGTTDAQRTIVAPLASIADVARTAGIQPPALIVVGEVVRMRERLARRAPTDTEERTTKDGERTEGPADTTRQITSSYS
jgi:uroporphyrin-III C-methyltransferase/precorrin-2 dehydrogenase/sirohydrochlorin ferrochelatase